MTFNPYHKWLGIPPEEQPPHHYRLLGIQTFESDPDVIASAADRQMAHVRSFQTGRHSAESQNLLNEIAQARVCLLSPDRKQEYDAMLRADVDAKCAPMRSSPKPKRKYDPPTIIAFVAAALLLVVAGIVFFLRNAGHDSPEAVASKPTKAAEQAKAVPKIEEPKPEPSMPAVAPLASSTMPEVAPVAAAPVPATDAQRAAAEVVFRAKGEITLENGRVCRRIDELPADAVFREMKLTREHPPISDDDLRVIASIRNPEKLTTLLLGLVPDVTDNGVEQIVRLTALQHLEIGASKITDAGLVKLTALRNLEFLMLGGSLRITNAGMAHYQKFPKLNELWLGGSAFSDEGLKGLRGMNLRVLCVGWNSNISDAGLGYLKLDKLEELVLNGTSVREQGARGFYNAHPGVKIKWNGGEIAATKAPMPASAPKAAPVAQLAEEPKPLRLTLAQVRKKLHGRASYDADTRVLTLFYDFKKRLQVEDFEGKFVWGNGFITIPATEQARFPVKFKTVNVNGMVAMKTPRITVVRSVIEKSWQASRNQGKCIGIGWYPEDYAMHLEGPDDSLKVLPFEVSVQPEKMSFRLADKVVSKKNKTPVVAGQIELGGGWTAEAMYSQLTISGEIDPKWAAEFFAP